MLKRGVRDLKSIHDAQDVQSRDITSAISDGYSVSSDPTRSLVQPPCSNVVNAPAAPDAIGEQLSSARDAWLQGRDTKALRRSLLNVLRALEEDAAFQ